MIHMTTFRAMGCEVTVQLEADQDGVTLLHDIPASVASIEACLTRFKPGSELMRLNAQAGTWVPVSEILFENIYAARHAALLTDGLYNPLVLSALIANGYDRSFEKIGITPNSLPVPVGNWREIGLRRATYEIYLPPDSALDLGGIAKGWTATYIADDLARYGACLVNIGGDMVGRGTPSDLPGWPVDINDPATDRPFALVYLHDSSIVTSGIDYRRWRSMNGTAHHHIIDPRNGRSAVTDVVTATITHPHAPTAEAFSKAVLLQGADQGLHWLNHLWHATGLVFRQDGAVLATSNFTSSTYERTH